MIYFSDCKFQRHGSFSAVMFFCYNMHIIDVMNIKVKEGVKIHEQ